MDEDEHYATVGCFLEDNSRQRFAVTNFHVTRHAKRLYLKTSTGAIHFGDSIAQIKRSSEDNLYTGKQPDVDMISVNAGLHCCNDITDPVGKLRRYKIFDGNIRKLYGQRVFKCLPKCNKETVLYGIIASFDVHRAKSIGDGEFIVEGIHGAFAKEGESGTPVALDTDSDVVHLVGIVCGGIQIETSNSLTQCLCLKYGFDFLEKKYNRSLKLNETNSTKSSKMSPVVQCGSKIYFTIPRQMKRSDFELHEHILTLTCNRFVDMDRRNVDSLKEREIYLSALVNDRHDIVTLENVSAHQTTLFHFMKGCEYLYSKDYSNTDKHLKLASMSLVGEHEFLFRLLCKLISYSTWYYLENNDLENMKILLMEGLTFMTENEHYVSFPKESLGYHYYDFSRYYLRVLDFGNAEEKANAAVELFRELDNASHTTDTVNRLILAVCQYAEVKLRCGDNFELIEQKVSENDISEAEYSLKMVENRVEAASVVQKMDYHIAVCDLQFRKGDYINALNTSKMCLCIATKNNIMDEKLWAEIRIATLERFVTSGQNI